MGDGFAQAKLMGEESAVEDESRPAEAAGSADAEASPGPPPARRVKLTALALAAACGLAYFFSNPKPQTYFDYTFRIAGALLGGRVGLGERPPSWLSEMVPFGGDYYSVFPLGSVLTMLPAALLARAGLIDTYPAAAVAAVAAGASSALFFLLSLRYDISGGRRWLLVLFMMFGTWMWCNVAFGGAWQIALGFAVVGQLGALYFTLVRPDPFAAGLLFALAFGNRTEVIVVAPLFMYLACRASAREQGGIALGWPTLRRQWPTLLQFCAVPFLLGVATLAYNYVRFQSPFDFGYARIPGVLEEPWYRHGIFSIRYIPFNANAMLLKGWRLSDNYPYLTPNPFGFSIFLASPLLVTVFRRGAREFDLKVVAWAAIALLTLALWLHGNPGGWQFSYRYALILLPWAFLIMLENSPRRVSATEATLFAISIAINAYATYLFLWTDHVRP